MTSLLIDECVFSCEDTKPSPLHADWPHLRPEVALCLTAHLNDWLATVARLRSRLENYRGRVLGEQNTKSSLIEPLLESLGWDIRDFDEVHHEYKPKRADRPVDYALQLQVKPVVFLEAKGLGENLDDRRWVSQILSYATVAGVTWCVLTDGDEYRFYNSTAPVDADEKLFCRVRISEAQPSDLAAAFELISRESLGNGRLSSYWKTHYVDRHVQGAVANAIESADPGLLRILRRRLPDFTAKQLADSLRRLQISVNAPAPAVGAASPGTEQELNRVVAAKKRKTAGIAPKQRRRFVGVTLEQVIQAGVLSAPLKVFRKYKGKMMQAIVLADGSVEFEGQRFATCSSAAEHARSTVTGRKMNTNGWSFWQYTDIHNRKRELMHARELFLNGAPKR